MADKSPPTLEHQEPPIYYCWTYWTSNGEVREGCTPVQPQEHEGWPDLNDYGWLYITIPIAIVLVLSFVVYLICSRSGNSKTIQKKSILVEESDDSDVEMEPTTRSKWPRVVSYPSNDDRARTERFYDVVHMMKPDNNAAPNRKVPPRGGVTAPMQLGLYPKLSTVRRQQSGARAEQEVNIDGRRVYTKPPGSKPTSKPANHYINDPTITTRKNHPMKPAPKVIEELSSSESEEDVVTENEEQSEDENRKET